MERTGTSGAPAGRPGESGRAGAGALLGVLALAAAGLLLLRSLEPLPDEAPGAASSPAVAPPPALEQASLDPSLSPPAGEPAVALAPRPPLSAAAHPGALPVEPAGAARLSLPVSDGPLWRETADGLVDARGRPLPSRPVRGRVVDDGGAPVVGAELRVLPGARALAALDAWPGWTGSPSRGPRRPSAVPDGLRERLPAVTSDGQGRFELSAPGLPGLSEAEALAPDRPARRRRGLGGSPVARTLAPSDDLEPGWPAPLLVVRAPGFETLVRDLGDVWARGGTVGDVTLERAWVLTGRVLDTAGQAISDAWIRLAPDEREGSMWFPGLRTVRSGGAGRFELPVSAGRGFSLLQVGAPGHVAVRRRSGGDIVLADAWPLEGRVLDEDGQPLAGALVLGAHAFELRSESTGHFSIHHWRGDDSLPQEWALGRRLGLPTVRSQASGRFVLDGLPHALRHAWEEPSRVDLYAWAPGRSLTVARGVAPGSRVDLVLPLAAELELRIVDPAGQPLPDARVTVRRWSGDDRELATCPVVAGEQPGVMVARHVGALSQYVEATAPGCAPRGWWVGGVAPGRRGRIELTLVPDSGATLDLLVVDDLGRPLPGVAVSAVQEGDWSLGRSRLVATGETGADGRLRLDGLAPQRAYLDLVLEGHARRRLPVDPAVASGGPASAIPLRVGVPRLSRLTLRLFGEGGYPGSHEAVRLEPMVLEPSDEQPPDRPVLAAERRLRATATGVVSVPDLEAGLWRLRLPDRWTTTLDALPGEHLEQDWWQQGDGWVLR